MPFSLIISGVTGHVGRALVDLVQRDQSVHLRGALASPESTNRVVYDGSDVRVNTAPNGPVDAVIDFSTDLGCRGAIQCAVEHGAALVVGTTGLSDETEAQLTGASASIPTMRASNTSLGATLLGALAASATRVLGPGYDVSMVETHRAGKRDAPSGTAKRLAQSIRDAGGAINDDDILSVRGGDVVGEHVIRFDGAGETLLLTHRATDRRLFAAGALRAAKWLAGREPRLYTMEESLGLE